MNCFNRSNIIKSSGLVILLLAWLLIYELKIYNPLLIPAPADVLDVLINFFFNTNYLYDFVTTAARVVTAWLASAALGIIFGLLFGYFKLLNEATGALIDFLRSIPGIILLPLFILFFGITDITRLMTAIFITTPIILINTKYGVIYAHNLRKNLRKIYKISWFRMFACVILPETSPYIFNGVRISLSLTIIVIIVTEMMMGPKYGLGKLIIESQYQFETKILFALIIILGALGYMLNLILNKIENKIFHWKNY